jgi:iron complex transport system substrate-binding protein
MNTVRRSVLFVVVALCALTAIGATGVQEGSATTGSTADPGYPMTVLDDTGMELTVERKPQRIVSVTTFTDDILLDLVEVERITAVTTFAEDESISNVADRVVAVPNKITLNVEIILSLRPDIVFVANWSEADKVQQLRNAGVEVFLLESGLTVAHIQEQIATVAKIVGEESNGVALIEAMNARLAAVEQKVAGIPEAERLAVLDYAIWGTAPGEGTSWAEILKFAGVNNSVEGFAVNEWGQVPVSREKLLELDPDILILPGWVYGDPEGAANNFKTTAEDPALRGMKAVVENRVYMMPEQIKASTSQYLVDAVEWLAAVAYPELFD